MPAPEGTSVQFITIMCAAGELASITMAAAMNLGPDRQPQPLTVDQYLLACHREHQERLKEGGGQPHRDGANL
jgi:hypothetical protein